MMLTYSLFISLVILISCIACNRLVLSLRGLYYSRAVGGSTTPGTLTRGQATIHVYPPSSGVVTLPDTSTFAAHDEEKMT